MSITKISKPIIIIKCMEKQYIQKMLEYGDIRLSCPGKWIIGEQNDGIGRGDKYEGTFRIDDTDTNLSKLKKKYGNNLIVNQEKSHIYYQLNTAISCPTFCFYTIEDKDIEILGNVENEGIYDAQVTIPGQFYQDFAKGRGITVEEIKKLPDAEQPALLIMCNENVYTFFDNFQSALKKQLNLVDSNILIDRVIYGYNRSGEKFECILNHPKELFYKNEELAYQQEARIVINSKTHRLKNYEKDYYDINIGSMKSYSEMHVGYTPEGTILRMKVQVSKIGNVEKRDGEVITGYKKRKLEINK